jgi:hypothetical protein
LPLKNKLVRKRTGTKQNCVGSLFPELDLKGSINPTALLYINPAYAVLVGRSTAKWENSAMVVSGNADQFGEGLSILSITITPTTALVG